MKSTVHRVVISQPMYFPWIGQLQQIHLCDNFVFYDDVKFTHGFFNRVQIKTNDGIRWLSVPLRNWKQGQLINEVRIDNTKNWKQKHWNQLKQAYGNCPFWLETKKLVDSVLSNDYTIISELAETSTRALISYYPWIAEGKYFFRSSLMAVTGRSSQRVVDICSKLGATHYLTGHGARNYLDYSIFEKKNIQVEFIEYSLKPYHQMHGEFTPYVSTLDIISNCGQNAVELVNGMPVSWQKFTQKDA
jgi:hypothetical protein